MSTKRYGPSKQQIHNLILNAKKLVRSPTAGVCTGLGVPPSCACPACTTRRLLNEIEGTQGQFYIEERWGR